MRRKKKNRCLKMSPGTSKAKLASLLFLMHRFANGEKINLKHTVLFACKMCDKEEI